MDQHVATVTGSTGPPVLLLAGGASSSHGFFPELVAALAGRRVVELDRPGTGRARRTGSATLPSGSAAAAACLRRLGAGPAVVVGQSLGGAVAVQLATDHPDLVAGLVLVDPTPLDVPGELRAARAIFAVLGLPGRLPVIGPRVDRALFRALGRQHAAHARTADAFEVMTTSAPLSTTGRAIRDVVRETAQLDARVARFHGPAVLLTADRPEGHGVRASHERLAERLGARLVAPPGAVHADHLRDPDGVNALVLDVVAAAFGPTPATPADG